jgi:hypothetical protein
MLHPMVMELPVVRFQKQKLLPGNRLDGHLVIKRLKGKLLQRPFQIPMQPHQLLNITLHIQTLLDPLIKLIGQRCEETLKVKLERGIEQLEFLL